MVPGAIHGNPLWEALYALGIVALAVAVAWLVLYLLALVVRRLTARTATRLDDLLLRAVRGPVAVMVVLQGVFVALTAVSFLNSWQPLINTAWGAGVLANVFWALQRLLSALLAWFGQEMAGRIGAGGTERIIPLLRRITGFVILAMGALVVMDRLGVSISPLLAGLGIGGLAVALALQPTLANFVSGTYVLSDGSLRPGDFIEVQGGPAGTVVDVGWRTTKIVSPPNNLITIPNSKLVDSVVTNYNQPQPAMNVVLTCGVSYESDLARVEETCLEVMRDLRARLPEAEKSFEPLVRFREFGDSNITFLCIMRAVDRGASFLVQHELTKSLHRRFQEDGIEINYPVRKLVYAGEGQARPVPPRPEKLEVPR
jgi:small-conductance mechanosensitive channel